MLLPGLVALALMPLVIHLLYLPESKNTPDAADFARGKLRELGLVSRDEKILLGVFALLLFLWASVLERVFDPGWAVDPTTAAFVGLGALLLSGVLTWEDLLKEKSAWDTVVWFSALVMMATYKLGLIAWLSKSLESGVDGLGIDWILACALLRLAYLYAHHLFASTTAHITAMFAAFYGAGLALGAPPPRAASRLAGSGRRAVEAARSASRSGSGWRFQASAQGAQPSVVPSACACIVIERSYAGGEPSRYTGWQRPSSQRMR